MLTGQNLVSFCHPIFNLLCLLHPLLTPRKGLFWIQFTVKNEMLFSGELFQAWEMWLSPHSEKPVGSKVGGQDPRPWIGSPVGNQACIVPWLLWDLLLLKLPHLELRQQMFTEYLYLPQIWARPSRYGTQPVLTISPFTLQISFFDVFSDILSFVVCKR